MTPRRMPSVPEAVVRCACCDEQVPDANVWICVTEVIAQCRSCGQSLPVGAVDRPASAFAPLQLTCAGEV
jgi:hypothetical protein